MCPAQDPSSCPATQVITSCCGGCGLAPVTVNAAAGTASVTNAGVVCTGTNAVVCLPSANDPTMATCVTPCAGVNPCKPGYLCQPDTAGVTSIGYTCVPQVCSMTVDVACPATAIYCGTGTGSATASPLLDANCKCICPPITPGAGGNVLSASVTLSKPCQSLATAGANLASGAPGCAVSLISASATAAGGCNYVVSAIETDPGACAPYATTASNGQPASLDSSQTGLVSKAILIPASGSQGSLNGADRMSLF